MGKFRQPWPLFFLFLNLASGQEIDTAIGSDKHITQATLFDEIAEQSERKAFRELWESREPHKQQQLAVDFVSRYPRSIVLHDAYEIGSRADVALGDYNAGLDWAGRSLRLTPENPFLLAMVADVAAKHGRPELAETSAHAALRYLEYSDNPAAVSKVDWPRIRNDLRETCYYALSRVAAGRGQNAEAEKLLLSALALNSTDEEALYLLGVVRVAAHEDDAAAPCFASLMRGNGPFATVARASLHQIYDRGSRTVGFEEYAGSLHWTPPQPARPETRLASQARYAGSESCRECHAAEYRNWQATGMAKMFRPYRRADVVGDFSGKPVLSGVARPVAEGDRRFIEIRQAESDRWIRYPVDYIIGSKWQQAYATKLSTGQIFVFPIQYSLVQSAWVNYWQIVDGPGSVRADIPRFNQNIDRTLYQRDCAPCHTSQLHFPNGTAPPESATYHESGINCEMCHGPSQAHVESAKAGKPANRPADGPPVDFKRLTAEQYVAICAQCHMQSAIHEPQPRGAVNYSEETGPFYRNYEAHLLSDFTRKAFYADGRFRATTFIVEAFKRSRCFRDGGATCGSCHNPHPQDAPTNSKSLKFQADSDEMCVQCHKTMRESPELHSHHSAGAEASRCVSCHMPRIMDAVLFRARSHQIDDIPDGEMTERFGQNDSPNACLACHQDRDAAWLRAQVAALWKKH